MAEGKNRGRPKKEVTELVHIGLEREKTKRIKIVIDGLFRIFLIILLSILFFRCPSEKIPEIFKLIIQKPNYWMFAFFIAITVILVLIIVMRIREKTCRERTSELAERNKKLEMMHPQFADRPSSKHGD